MNYNDNVVVFGGTSFIGQHLCKALDKKGCEVISLNNPSTGKKSEYAKQNLDVDICNPAVYLSNLNMVSDIFCGHIDCIYVASWAGTNDRENDELNKKSAEGLYYCLEYLLGNNECEKVIQLGTQAEYGRGYDVVNESTPCNPITAYGQQKLRFANMADALCKKNNICFVEFRIHSVYGKGRGGVIEWLIRQLTDHDEVQLKTKCNQMFDYVYIDDCIEALILGKGYLINGSYNISSGERISLKQYFEIIRSIVNPNGTISYGETVDESGPDFTFDSSKLRNETGWKPKYSFEQGIIEMGKA